MVHFTEAQELALGGQHADSHKVWISIHDEDLSSLGRFVRTQIGQGCILQISHQ